MAVAVAALVLALAPVAAAKPGGGHKPAPAKAFTVQGKVTAIDSTAGTLAARVWSGSKGIARYRGKEMVLTPTASVKVTRLANGKLTTITLADVKVGDRIRAWGWIDRSDPNTVVYHVRRLLVRSTWPLTVQGAVSATDTTANTLTVKVNRASFGVKEFIGSELSLKLTAKAVVAKVAGGDIAKITLADLKVGDKVLVLGKVDNTDPSNAVYFARFVLVKG